MDSSHPRTRGVTLIDTIGEGGHAAEGVARMDVEAVNAAARRKLYKTRVPIYPKLVAGPFRAFKWLMLFFCLGVYYLLPWIRWPRGEGQANQAVLVDFEGRRFYFFFIELWPDEVYFITGLLIMAALGLFLVTALFGRVWCGYACPQTIWTDLYIAVERMIEGDRNARIKLDRAPWTTGKLAKKSLKHAIWLMIGFMTGGAWILYFHDAPSLARDFFVGQAPATAYIFAAILTVTTYVLAGSLREQVCTYMCPWPRIQAAMTDADALQVTYRADRGEPRGPHKKGDPWEGRGDCIDCNQCVAACPMGIDIRDGDQLECINCALCIDACDAVMAKIGRPKGLVAYDTALNVGRRQEGAPASWRFARPRTAVYAVALAAVTGVVLVGLFLRPLLDLDVIADRNPPYVRLSDGSVRNGFTLKVSNKTPAARALALSFGGVAGARVKVLGGGADGDNLVLRVGPDREVAFRVLVTAPSASLTGPSLPVSFSVADAARGDKAGGAATFLTGRGP